MNFRGAEFENLINKIRFINSNCVIDYTNPKYTFDYYSIICDEFFNADKNNFCCGLLSTILGYYADIYPAAKSGINTQTFLNATILVSENYNNSEFSIYDISQKLKISTATLYRLFIKFVGISPNRYINNYRITMAKNLIDDGASISTAALSCGFKDPLYFSRVFKSFTSVSPSDYKKRDTENIWQETHLHKNE